MDFELYFVLFLSQNIDPGDELAQSDWMKLISVELGWNSFHQKLLNNKMEKLPSYDLENLVIASKSREFGLRLYANAYLMVSRRRP